MLITLSALPIGPQRLAVALAPSRDPSCLDCREHTVDLFAGVDREARLGYATVTGPTNTHMHVWRRMVAETKHDDDSLEACDPRHPNNIRSRRDALSVADGDDRDHAASRAAHSSCAALKS
jgi:hypothetical protein